MAEPVSLSGNPPPPPKPFFESPILFFVIETITLAATREVYKNTRSTTFSLITFVAGTGFAIKPKTIWNGFINLLNSLPDSPTTYVVTKKNPRRNPPRRGPDIVVVHNQAPTLPPVATGAVFTSGKRAVPKSQQPTRYNHSPTQSYSHPPAAPPAVVTNGQRAVSKSRPTQQAAQPPIVTSGQRAQSKRRKN